MRHDASAKHCVLRVSKCGLTKTNCAVAMLGTRRSANRSKSVRLFVPIISASTDARSEGYFRLEWRLAVERSHLMADDQAFLLPVAH